MYLLYGKEFFERIKPLITKGKKFNNYYLAKIETDADLIYLVFDSANSVYEPLYFGATLSEIKVDLYSLMYNPYEHFPVSDVIQQIIDSIIVELKKL